MEKQQYIKILCKRQFETTNNWLRLARKSAYSDGILNGGKQVAIAARRTVDFSKVVIEIKKSHRAEISASKIANNVNKMLSKLIKRR